VELYAYKHVSRQVARSKANEERQNMNEREAEDSAYELWRAGTMGSEACSLNQEAWRAGFRLGRESMPKVVPYVATAPADSELGIELSKIRDRLNALESMSLEVANQMFNSNQAFKRGT
jgi:hypothetical protein